jgi:hypothetical protein
MLTNGSFFLIFSMAMWDVTLGRPFVRRALSHTRSVNTVRLMNHPFVFAVRPLDTL